MSKKTWDKTSEPSQETKIGAGNESPKVPDKNLKKLHRGSDRLWNWSKRKSLTRDFLFSSISRVGVKFFDTFRSFEGKFAQLYFGAIANSDNPFSYRSRWANFRLNFHFWSSSGRPRQRPRRRGCRDRGADSRRWWTWRRRRWRLGTARAGR